MADTPKNPERHHTFMPKDKKSSKDFHSTPNLDELEKGPWPSFVTGLKRLAMEEKFGNMVQLLRDVFPAPASSPARRVGLIGASVTRIPVASWTALAIAAAVGYSDVVSFYHAFRAEEPLTPRRFRAIHRIRG